MSESDLVIDLTGIAHGGDAVGRHKGKVVFVPHAIPGERVRVHVRANKRGYSRATLREVLVPSPHRVVPPCPHFGTCGGCQWQHIDYAAQLAYKQQIIGEQLRRIGKIEDPLVTAALGMTEPWRYRNRAQYSVSPGGRLGFRAARSHRVVPIETCPLLDPLVEEVCHMLDIGFRGVDRVVIHACGRTDDAIVVFEGSTDEVPVAEIDAPVSCLFSTHGGDLVVLAGRPYVEEQMAGHLLRVSTGSFFQVNVEQAERMVALLKAHLELSAGDHLVDAYCGVGTLGLPLAGRVAEVIGIESCHSAVEDARHNAEGLSNVRVIEGRTRDVLPDVLDCADVVILDPPRQGCHSDVVAALCAAGPARVAYVSCDPATLARDVGLLVHRGDYRLLAVQPIDMFPQTYHIESVSLLARQ